MDTIDFNSMVDPIIHGGLWDLFVVTTIVMTFALLYSRLEMAWQRGRNQQKQSIYAGPRVKTGVACLILGVVGVAASLALIWGLDKPTTLVDGVTAALNAANPRDRLFAAIGIASALIYDFGALTYLASEIQ